MRLQTKITLITGAASGIGAEIARTFIREGAQIVLADINPGGADIAAQMGAQTEFAELDVTSEASWQALTKRIADRHGRLHCLVNSAGIALFKDIEHTSLQEWRQVLSVNLDGVFLGCKATLPLLKGSGSIINISSISGIVGGHNLAAYNASKGGVRLLTKSIALHCARQGYNIRCNSVHPTFVDTPMVRDLINASSNPEKLEHAFRRQIPLGRLGTPQDVAELALYLASDESSFVTGAEFIIDGGVTAQ